MKETDHLGGEGAIKMDLLETVYEDVDWIRMAYDTEYWRAFWTR
jgi:hypothetical protein